jgi:hypothetical protein
VSFVEISEVDFLMQYSSFLSGGRLKFAVFYSFGDVFAGQKWVNIVNKLNHCEQKCIGKRAADGRSLARTS